jgi:large subunit ribosomal protein L2
MAMKSFRPITPVLRYKTIVDYSGLTAEKPIKSLLLAKRQAGGRNNTGRITVRRRGGGHRRFYRIVDFKRDKVGITGLIERIEYDPNRTCHIALVKYADGERRYMLATVNMKAGDKVVSGEQCEIAEGNCLQLKHIPPGTQGHNIEMIHGKGGQIVRSAGAYAEILSKENNLVQIKLPSTEIRAIPETCRATIGQVSNIDHMNVVIGSAGRSRWLGWRPRVRAVAMNPVDHPMGGGEGRTSGGRHPCSPQAQKAKGLKTRKKKNLSNKYIIRRRIKKNARSVA